MVQDASKARAGYVTSRLIAMLGALVAALALAGEAAAQRPCGNSAIDQYVECPPQVGDENAPDVTKPTKTPLPTDVRTRLFAEGGEDAPILEEIATSSVYGAPQRSAAGNGSGADASGGGPGGPRRGGDGSTPYEGADPRDDVSAGEAVSAAVGAVGGGEAGRMAGLLVFLVLISVAALAAAALRHRRRST